METIALIGLGASNTLLLHALDRTGVLKDMRILVFDISNKGENDKTYCFWAHPKSTIVADLNDLILTSWEKVYSGERVRHMTRMCYYMIEAAALYTRGKSLLEQYPNIEFIQESVSSLVSSDEGCTITANDEQHFVDRVYDSRPPKMQEEMGDTVLQSFVGWKIKTPTPVFDPSTFTLMDFSVPQDGGTQFVYVLPTSEREAMIELTRFSTKKIDDSRAAHVLAEYCAQQVDAYVVEDKEFGVIPMSQDIQVEQQSSVTPMGARAGKVKATTGYGFKAMYEHAEAIAAFYAQPEKTVSSPSWIARRFQWYDTLLLLILKFRPEWGATIFNTLLKNERTEEIFRFLEERSTLSWEVRMFARLPVPKFLWSVGLYVHYKISKHAWRFMPLALSLIALVLSQFQPQLVLPVIGGILAIVLFAVGIPHGALDAYVEQRKEALPVFILKYVGIMAAALLLWWWMPALALIGFLGYSAWHFGQTDLEEWRIPTPGLSLLWGTVLMGMLLVPHWDSVVAVLGTMGVSAFEASLGQTQTATIVLSVVGLVLALAKGSWKWLLTVVTLIATTGLPLVIAFGVYFVLRHSVVGWRHLRRSQRWTTAVMWKRAAPFTFGALLMFGALLYVGTLGSATAVFGKSMIFLSALSLPHVYYMSSFYRNRTH